MSEPINTDKTSEKQIFKILRDPIWQFVGAFLALAAIVAAFILPNIISKKEVSVKITYSTIIANQSFLQSDIKILYKNKNVDNISITEIKFKNTGNTNILPSDIIETIKVKLVKCSIIGSQVVSSFPEWLKDSIKINQKDSETIEFLPFLLNKSESFAVRLLTRDCSPKYSFTSRIIDLPQLTIISGDQTNRWLAFLLIFLVVCCFVSSVNATGGEYGDEKNRLEKLYKLKIDTEKRYLFEPERTKRLKSITDEMNSIKNTLPSKYTKTNKVYLIFALFFGIATVVVLFLLNQPTI